MTTVKILLNIRLYLISYGDGGQSKLTYTALVRQHSYFDAIG